MTIAVADPSVPVGGFTNDVLDKMGKSSDYGPDYVTAVKGRIFVTLGRRERERRAVQSRSSS